VVLQRRRQLQLTPGSDFDALAAGTSRNVSFTYTATDNNGGVSAVQTITITVTGTNDLPVAYDSTATTSENVILNGNVPAATDLDGSIVGYTLVSGQPAPATAAWCSRRRQLQLHPRQRL